MIKGILKAYNPAGTFLLPLSNFNHHFTEHGNIAFLLNFFPPMDTILVVFIRLFEPKFIYKDTQFDDDNFS